MMKAIQCSAFGPPDGLTLKTIDEPVVDHNDVLIEVIAAGVNFPDGLVVQGKYQVKPSLPFVPGMELCGNVIEVGDKVSGISVGDRVVSTSPSFGAFAEKIAIPYQQAIKIPQSIDPTEACSLLVAYGTAHHALKQRANLKPGETLVVLGAAGGTGLAAVQIGKAMGATVIAAASSEDKLNFALQNGADHAINYTETDLKQAIREHTNDRGADVVYDPVGGDQFESSVRAIAPNGRLLVIGFASGTIPKFPINLALVKEISLIGVFWGAFTNRQPELFHANMTELIDWYQKDKVSVQIDKTFTLTETADALNYVMSRQVRGKVAITVS